MTIGCTRCGAREDGQILSPPIAFAFKHNKGCGHGVGPLAVIPDAKKTEKPKSTAEKHGEIQAKEVIKEIEKEIKVEEKVKEDKPKKSKFSSFGKKE